MSAKDLYLQLLLYPHSPKSYRDLKNYYQKANMSIEADAFDFLLQTKFQEIPKLHVNDSSANQKQ